MGVSGVEIAGGGLQQVALPTGDRVGWRLAFATTATWAAAVALLMSTQYLLQPFVWMHWPWDEVLLGWCTVIVERMLVALCIAAALVLVTRVPAERTSVRGTLLAFAIAAGAITGEALIVLLSELPDSTPRGFSPTAVLQWSLLAACVAGIYSVWARTHRAQAAARAHEHARSSADALATRTELESLRRQVDPHFLFNTLATIRHLKEAESAEGTRLLGHLIAYLDATGRRRADRATLGDEIDLVSSQLAIIGLRMGLRLATEIEVPAALRPCMLPPLSLATLVENAVRHGIMPMQQGGRIAVRARRLDSTLEVTVEDTGAGMHAADAQHGGTGIGLSNLRARLRTLYGQRAQLIVSGNMPRGVRATIRVPIEAATT